MRSWQVMCVVSALLGVGCSVGGPGGEPGDEPLNPNLPVDTRAAIVAETPPPSITGGTLLVVDGFTAVAADTDRDRVSIVDLRDQQVIAHIALNPGDQPGRLVAGGDGLVHVVLRGSGEEATIDLSSASIASRTQVGGAPPGIAHESPTSQLTVACQGGELVTLNVDTDEETRALRGVAVDRVLHVGNDLRDVILQGDQVLISRFKSADLLEVDHEGVVHAERALRSTSQLTERRTAEGEFTQEFRDFDPTIAWRTLPLPDGKVAVVHQRSMASEIELDDPHNGDPGEDMPLPSDPYGGGSVGSCDAIVQSAVSIVDEEGNVTHTPSIAGSVLPVDATFDASNNMLLVVNAGLHDPGAPTRTNGLDFGGMGDIDVPPGFFNPSGATTSGSVSRVALASASSSENFLPGTCMNDSIPVDGQPVAIALAGDGGMVVQSREPAMLMLVGANGVASSIALGGGSVMDTGHEVFHRDAGAGIACASCHAEGAEDGHVWRFSTFGDRRTQAINVGLEGTEPFHWSGDMPRLSTLVAEVFVERMGGAQQTSERLGALGGWLFAQQPSAPIRAANDPAAMRGHELFNSQEVGCNNCHSGAKFTNNQTVDVGTGEPMQVPSLLGVAHRAPFIHTGCAPTLQDRFTDTACGGGDMHGNTSQLDSNQINDLVAYLETL